MLASNEQQRQQLSQGQPPWWHIKRAALHSSVANSERGLDPQWAGRGGWALTTRLDAAAYVAGTTSESAAAVATAAVTAASAAHRSDRRRRLLSSVVELILVSFCNQ